MRRFLLAVSATAALAGAMAASPASAQDRHRDWHDDHRGWHDRDIHHFNDYDVGRWRGGRWYQGPHDGRRGWWWIVGGAWYFYPQPIYPYPDPYQPPVVAGPPGPPPGGPVYYFCPRPRGYYPYVPSCRTPWQAVPAG